MHLILSTDARERVLLRSFCKVEARKENTFTPVRLCVGGRGVAHTHVQGSQQLAASLGTESPSLKTTRPTQSTIFILFKKRTAVLLFNCLKKEVGEGVFLVFPWLCC